MSWWRRVREAVWGRPADGLPLTRPAGGPPQLPCPECGGVEWMLGPQGGAGNNIVCLDYLTEFVAVVHLGWFVRNMGKIDLVRLRDIYGLSLEDVTHRRMQAPAAKPKIEETPSRLPHMPSNSMSGRSSGGSD